MNGVLFPMGVLILSDKLPNNGKNIIAASGLNIHAYDATQLGTPNSPKCSKYKIKINHNYSFKVPT